MRSTVYFLPARTSVTGSVGISTLPIFSCSPKAIMRDSSDSLTFFSNPEYVWMMYHFMFGFAFSVEPGCAPASGSPSAPVMFCSVMLCTDFPVFLPPTVQHPIHCAADSLVDDEKIHAKNNDCNNHHHCRRLDFLSTGKGDLPHFIADVREKIHSARRELLELVAHALLVARYGYCFCHCFLLSSMRRLPRPASSLFPFVRPISGRGGGIRTPKSGFGDRQFSR